MLGPQLAARMGSVDGRHHAFSGVLRGGKRHGMRGQVKQMAGKPGLLRHLCPSPFPGL
jgi:hypothetical protein